MDDQRPKKRRVLLSKNKISRDGVPKQNHEIWFEILTRLPLKSFLVSQLVCKSWKKKIGCVVNNTKYLPLCGLVLKSSSFGVPNNKVCVSYLNTLTKEITSLQSDVGGNSGGNSMDITPSLEDVFSIPDNSEYGLISNLSLDFSRLLHIVRNVSSSTSVTSGEEFLSLDFNKLSVDRRPQSSYSFFAIHKGLMLVVREDGHHSVNNPVTKTITRLRKPPTLVLYNRNKYLSLPPEKAGFIIKANDLPLHRGCFFKLVRICRLSKVVEVCKSYRRPLSWKVCKFGLDDQLINAYWCWENYVVIGSKSLFFLTSTNRGVALRFQGHHKVNIFGFGLPLLVQDEFKSARLGECGSGLNLSYYDSDGIWIWKHGDNGLSVTPDAWIPLFEISHYRQLCKPVAKECFCSVLYAGGASVIPIGFHPDVEIVFIQVNSSIFAYDLVKDTLQKIAEIDDSEYGASTLVLPYTPCIASVEG